MEDHHITGVNFSQFISQFIDQQNIPFIEGRLHADVDHSHTGKYRINCKIKITASNNVWIISIKALRKAISFLARPGGLAVLKLLQ